MSYLGTKSLTELLKDPNIIKPLNPDRIKNGAYEMSLGRQVFETDSRPRAIMNLDPDEEIYIEPGQFALLLTEEYVKIPENRIAFITIKAGIKFKGLINVSGFTVDPGFEGHILFSVYNAGPSTIILNRGTNYFPIYFAELNEFQKYEGNHNKQKRIPNEPVEALSQGELSSPNVLSKRIEDVEHLKTKIEWVVLAILTGLIAFSVRLWTINSDLKEAIDFGYQKKTQEIDSLYIDMQKHLIFLDTKIDSLINANRE